jgi:hypothetical protein
MSADIQACGPLPSMARHSPARIASDSGVQRQRFGTDGSHSRFSTRQHSAGSVDEPVMRDPITCRVLVRPAFAGRCSAATWSTPRHSTTEQLSCAACDVWLPHQDACQRAEETAILLPLRRLVLASGVTLLEAAALRVAHR